MDNDKKEELSKIVFSEPLFILLSIDEINLIKSALLNGEHYIRLYHEIEYCKGQPISNYPEHLRRDIENINRSYDLLRDRTFETMKK